MNDWYGQQISQLKKQELDRKLEQRRLLKEAGLAGQERPADLGRKIYAGMLALVRGSKAWILHVPASFKRSGKQTL